MGWKIRTDKRSGDKAHGITFVMAESSRARGEVAVGARKLHADGVGSLTLAFDQYRYGDELIAQLYTQEAHRVLAREADGWMRLQIFLGRVDASMLAALEHLVVQVRNRLGGNS